LHAHGPLQPVDRGDVTAKSKNAQIYIKVNISVRSKRQQVSLHSLDIVAGTVLTIFYVGLLLAANRRIFTSTGKYLIATLRTWDPYTRGSTGHCARLFVGAMDSGITLLFQTKGAKLRAKFTASSMRTTGTTLNSVWWPRLVFMTGRPTSVTACAVRTITSLQTQTMVDVIRFLFFNPRDAHLWQSLLQVCPQVRISLQLAVQSNALS
jgi:hypothetical protein